MTDEFLRCTDNVSTISYLDKLLEYALECIVLPPDLLPEIDDIRLEKDGQILKLFKGT